MSTEPKETLDGKLRFFDFLDEYFFASAGYVGHTKKDKARMRRSIREVWANIKEHCTGAGIYYEAYARRVRRELAEFESRYGFRRLSLRKIIS
ncbi:MAG: hypothetical protein AABW87_03220 [Nanoarchaeota archaeon]